MKPVLADRNSLIRLNNIAWEKRRNLAGHPLLSDDRLELFWATLTATGNQDRPEPLLILEMQGYL